MRSWSVCASLCWSWFMAGCVSESWSLLATIIHKNRIPQSGCTRIFLGYINPMCFCQSLGVIVPVYCILCHQFWLSSPGGRPPEAVCSPQGLLPPWNLVRKKWKNSITMDFAPSPRKNSWKEARVSALERTRYGRGQNGGIRPWR